MIKIHMKQNVTNQNVTKILTINKRDSAAIKNFNDSADFTEYSNDMNDIYENTEENNPNKKRKILIIFDDTIPDMLSKK